MTDQMRSAAQAALDLLSDMTRLRTQPEAAKRMLQSLNSRHADVMMRLLRRAHGLYTSEATESWMRHRGFTQLQLESMVSEHLAHERLQQRAVAGEVAGYLDSRMHELDVARVALIEVASEAMAFRLREKVSNGASGFVAAMHEAFVTGDPGTTCRFATLRRREAISDIETQLFAAAPGEVVGPVRTGASYVLGCLLDAVQPCDTASAHAAAEQALFDEWLRSRRSEAAITWHWGRLPAESQGPT